MFIRINHTLKAADKRRVHLTASAHYEMNIWRFFINSMPKSLVHLRKICREPPTWTGATYESLKRMDRVCHRPEGQGFVWCLQIGKTTSQRLLTERNPEGDLPTNDIEIA